MILMATYIINRLPSKVVGNKTPYELLHGEKPSYDHRRVLGCMAYYWSIETKGDKFEIRGWLGVFMGYPSGTKGYKINDPSHNKIIISSDVKFVEKVFPFATKIKEKEHEEEDVFRYPFNENHESTRPIETHEETETKDLGLDGPFDLVENNEQEEMEELGPNNPVDHHINFEATRLSQATNGSVGTAYLLNKMGMKILKSKMKLLGQ
ncbi:putative RNA-directed DNA polymerase [Helianthus annuus]|nr:putative RNA-directed DNA polymerase [Helianthus annuus]KAJ0441761.1 putative RNA-directed DNA polymerase [Helianthus annuus]KAJ0459665.1 putative RNA-directed DNA polymerase [Helianthus annuus]KAJ0640146.1 putative RNA-directed DNA polymerase [Helianthus annuus]